MPSITHEALVLLFRNRPELAPELLRDALGVALPAYAEARVEAADLSDVRPAEYRADLVILLVDGKPVLAIVVEVQLQRDERKAFTWPVYVAGLRARFECASCVLVVTPSEAVADWARTPIELGPGSRVAPFVVGPKAIPMVRDVEAAKRDPELAVLSAMAHGKGEEGPRIAFAALAASVGLNEERALLYSDVILASLSEVTRAAMEELMASGNYEYQSEFAKTHQAKGRAEGRAEGEARGEARGKAQGEARAVLTVLDARGVVVSPEQQARILASTDLEVLERWLRKVVTVTSADELFTA
jgi:hypothetical protein